MVRSKLSRGIQMQYIGLLVAVVLSVPASAVRAAVVLFMPSAAQAVEVLAVYVPTLAGEIVVLVGLMILRRFHPSYRRAMVALGAGLLISTAGLLPLPEPAGTALAAGSAAAGLLHCLWFVRATNHYLRQAGSEKVVRRGRWYLAVTVLAAVWASVLPLLPTGYIDGWWESSGYIAAWRTRNFMAGVSFVLAVVPVIVELCYVVSASDVLKYWPPAETLAPADGATE